MKKLLIVIYAALLLVVSGGCRKPYEYKEPKITEAYVTIDRAAINGLSVGFWVEVNFEGEKEMKVEISQNEDFSDSQIYTMSQDEPLYVHDLVFACKYYYRFIVSNPNFSLVSETKSFKISEIHLFYGFGGQSSNLGYSSHDFSIEWAAMFPTSTLIPFEGSSISKVQAYVGERG